jgi:hypothetical protein
VTLKIIFYKKHSHDKKEANKLLINVMKLKKTNNGDKINLKMWV